MKNHQTWRCKIGVVGPLKLPPGADLPMREAIQEAFFQITGVHADFIFSGWNAQLDDAEAEVVDDKDFCLEDLDSTNQE